MASIPTDRRQTNALQCHKQTDRLTEKGMGKEGDRERLGQSASHADPTGNNESGQRQRQVSSAMQKHNERLNN